MRLEITDHDSSASRREYVYPVLSRRTGGVSVGVNLNPNHACNWRCVYCQVPGLVRGAAPELDLQRLEDELVELIDEVRAERAAGDAPPLVDVAIAGDGEPTTSRQFDGAVARIGAALDRCGLRGELPVVLITNGSLVQRAEIGAGLERLARMGGEVWFKLDSATRAGRRRLNDVDLTDERVAVNLRLAARACPTWVQSMLLALDGELPDAAELGAYLEFLTALRDEQVPLRGVQLYGPARPSRQPEAPRIAPAPPAWVAALAERVRRLGFAVRVHP